MYQYNYLSYNREVFNSKMSSSVLKYMTIILVISLHISRNNVAAELTVEAESTVVEVGDHVTFVCSHEGNNTVVLQWTFQPIRVHENSADSSVKQSIQPVPSTDGLLNIKNVSLGDAGKYTCSDNAGSKPQSTPLKVYIMPDYSSEIVTVLAILLVLVVLLVVGIVMSLRYEKRRTKKGGPKSSLSNSTLKPKSKDNETYRSDSISPAASQHPFTLSYSTPSTTSLSLHEQSQYQQRAIAISF